VLRAAFNWVFINEDAAADLGAHFAPFHEYFEQFEPSTWRFVVKEGFDVNATSKS
jgi:hypothetical protein